MKPKIDDICKVDAGYIFAQFLKGKLKKGQGRSDLDLLHKQKIHLIEQAALLETCLVYAKQAKLPALIRSRKKALDATNGLIGFLDAFQDMLVDDMKVWSYPKEKK